MVESTVGEYFQDASSELCDWRIVREVGFVAVSSDLKVACNSRTQGPSRNQPSFRLGLLKLEASQSVEGVGEKRLTKAGQDWGSPCRDQI